MKTTYIQILCFLLFACNPSSDKSSYHFGNLDIYLNDDSTLATKAEILNGKWQYYDLFDSIIELTFNGKKTIYTVLKNDSLIEIRKPLDVFSHDWYSDHYNSMNIGNIKKLRGKNKKNLRIMILPTWGYPECYIFNFDTLKIPVYIYKNMVL